MHIFREHCSPDASLQYFFWCFWSDDSSDLLLMKILSEPDVYSRAPSATENLKISPELNVKPL